MTEEELKTKQEELERKEGELSQKESDLKKKEEALNEKETSSREHEADASKITQTLKQEFEARLAKKEEEFNKRLAERDAVIKELASGDETAKAHDDSPIELLNKKRRAQKAA